jgi:uncharacterized protein YggT (Ycf19 family)
MNNVALLTDALFLLLWVRLFADADREFYFNPLLSGPMRLVDRVFAFLRPVFGPLNGRIVAFLLLAFFLAFRGTAAGMAGADWTLDLGLTCSRRLPAEKTSSSLLFSAVDFLQFLVRLWGLALFVALITPSHRDDRASTAFRFYLLPLSALPRLPLAVCVVLLNGLLVIVFQHVGVPLSAGELPEGLPLRDVRIDWDQPAPALAQLGWLTACSLADVLLVARGAMLLLVLIALLAAMMQNPGLQQICNEGIQVLLGRFSRRPLAVGLFDLTPIVYFLVLNLVYGFTIALLHARLATLLPVSG